MKQIMSLILCGILLLSIALLACPASASVWDGLDTAPVSEESRTSFLENLNVTLLEEAVEQNTIACFGVNEDGSYALGFESFETKTVYVYYPSGAFQYGIKFNYPGSFGIFFSGGDLSIYLSRSMYAATFDTAGQCIDVRLVTMAGGNNERIKDMLYGTQIKCGGDTYLLERDFALMERSYSRLVVRHADGSRQVLYDITSAHTVATIASIVFIIGFAAMLAVIGVYWKRKKEDEDGEE